MVVAEMDSDMAFVTKSCASDCRQTVAKSYVRFGTKTSITSALRSHSGQYL